MGENEGSVDVKHLKTPIVTWTNMCGVWTRGLSPTPLAAVRVILSLHYPTPSPSQSFELHTTPPPSLLPFPSSVYLTRPIPPPPPHRFSQKRVFSTSPNRGSGRTPPLVTVLSLSQSLSPGFHATGRLFKNSSEFTYLALHKMTVLSFGVCMKQSLVP